MVNEDRLNSVEEKALVRQASKGCLEAFNRLVLTLVYLYELNYWEISEILKVPLGTVKSRLARARMQMRQKLRNDTVQTMD